MREVKGRSTYAFLLCLICFTCDGANARAQTTSSPEIDVVSVRPSNRADTTSTIGWHPNRFVATNVPLRMLVLEAYGIPGALEERLLVSTGAMQRILTARFDVQATLTGEALIQSVAQRQLVLRQLLALRFGMKAHVEKRSIPTLRLLVARKGVIGPQLRPSQLDCNQWRAARRAAMIANNQVSSLTPPVEIGNPSDASAESAWCMRSQQIIDGIRRLRYSGPIDTLVEHLQPDQNTLIVNDTGLPGNFQWDLSYTSGLLQRFFPESPVPGLSTAVREQLGLRLEDGNTRVDVYVVDALSMPSPN